MLMLRAEVKGESDPPMSGSNLPVGIAAGSCEETEDILLRYMYSKNILQHRYWHTLMTRTPDSSWTTLCRCQSMSPSSRYKWVAAADGPAHGKTQSRADGEAGNQAELRYSSCGVDLFMLEFRVVFGGRN